MFNLNFIVTSNNKNVLLRVLNISYVVVMIDSISDMPNRSYASE